MPQPIEQLQHHRLHRDVEGCRRFIQHQQERPASDGAGNADPGLLAARELMRKARQQLDLQSNALRAFLHPLP
jgi:hypothetical protein